MIADLYQQSVFTRYHSDKHFSEFLPTRWRQNQLAETTWNKLRVRHPVIRVFMPTMYNHDVAKKTGNNRKTPPEEYRATVNG